TRRLFQQWLLDRMAGQLSNRCQRLHPARTLHVRTTRGVARTAACCRQGAATSTAARFLKPGSRSCEPSRIETLLGPARSAGPTLRRAGAALPEAAEKLPWIGRSSVRSILPAGKRGKRARGSARRFPRRPASASQSVDRSIGLRACPECARGLSPCSRVGGAPTIAQTIPRQPAASAE